APAQILDALALQFGRLLEGGIQVGDIALMMLAVMDLHRLRIDVRLERGEVVWELWQFVSHSSSYRRMESYYEMESMRSSATRFQCFCSAGTTIWLCTRPSTSSSRIQSRWFGETRNIVEHRQPNWSGENTLPSGAIL